MAVTMEAAMLKSRLGRPLVGLQIIKFVHITKCEHFLTKRVSQSLYTIKVHLAYMYDFSIVIFLHAYKVDQSILDFKCILSSTETRHNQFWNCSRQEAESYLSLSLSICLFISFDSSAFLSISVSAYVCL